MVADGSRIMHRYYRPSTSGQPAVLARSNTFSSSPTPAPSSTSFLFIILIHSLTLTLARE